MAGGKHVNAWVAEKGPGPWSCWGCGEPVNTLGGGSVSETVIVHHMDKNPMNNEIENLRAMHHGCRVSYHDAKRVVSDESRQRMSAAQKRRRAQEPPEVRDKFVRSMTGKSHTEEARRKMSAAQKNRPPVSEETRRKMADAARGNTNMVGRPVSEETKQKIAEKLRGRKHTPEAIKNITEANRRRVKKRKDE